MAPRWRVACTSLARLRSRRTLRTEWGWRLMRNMCNRIAAFRSIAVSRTPPPLATLPPPPCHPPSTTLLPTTHQNAAWCLTKLTHLDHQSQVDESATAVICAPLKPSQPISNHLELSRNIPPCERFDVPTVASSRQALPLICPLCAARPIMPSVSRRVTVPNPTCGSCPPPSPYVPTATLSAWAATWLKCAERPRHYTSSWWRVHRPLMICTPGETGRRLPTRHPWHHPRRAG